MTEIEEKAYNYYKRINEDDLKNIDTFGEPTRTRIKYMQTLLNQIQNQEKEIEEQKERLDGRYYHSVKLRELEIAIEEDWQDKIRQIRDKAECMDYYSLNDVIDDLTKLIGDGESEES